MAIAGHYSKLYDLTVEIWSDRTYKLEDLQVQVQRLKVSLKNQRKENDLLYNKVNRLLMDWLHLVGQFK